ncbi:hypothetical protein HNQ81_000027 [Desulfoprunum benzoelyticum]|uniref:Uncharacterized protein n=1 Tax=Desulfoprunum benzoelyticum TaxID=1506996 RepID=A0A840UXU6_9BACT|nr:hypothetical protein [Desulfoprunum benzoelyticum]MBB5346320.1 hypothetical protein [Desulfoprunum benzoelyticum]
MTRHVPTHAEQAWFQNSGGTFQEGLRDVEESEHRFRQNFAVIRRGFFDRFESIGSPAPTRFSSPFKKRERVSGQVIFYFLIITPLNL